MSNTINNNNNNNNNNKSDPKDELLKAKFKAWLKAREGKGKKKYDNFQLDPKDELFFCILTSLYEAERRLMKGENYDRQESHNE